MCGKIDKNELKMVLGRMLHTDIADADYDTRRLHGGTLGDVMLVSGSARTGNDTIIPYKVVLKSQTKWERPGDPDSWRREHDLYISCFEKVFTGSLRWPECYHTEVIDDRIIIWMEYIEGATGEDLSIDMLEKTAFEIGYLQGRVVNNTSFMNNISCLGDSGVFKREYMQWHRQTYSYEYLISDECRLPDFLKQMYKDGKLLYNEKTLEYNYLRSSECGIPIELKSMLMDIDDRMDSIFCKIEKLPVVMCHRDLWTENIFYTEKGICLIDWDSSGWGYLGEDIVSLIADETDASDLNEYYHRLIPAYLKGISENMDISHLGDFYIWEMIIIKFGYRILQEYMFTQSAEVKEEQVNILKELYTIMHRRK